MCIEISIGFVINSGILPITFENEKDYDNVDMYDNLEFFNIKNEIIDGKAITIRNVTKGLEIKGIIELSQRQKNIIIAGGLLNYTKQIN
jgi:aconitate hydratase